MTELSLAHSQQLPLGKMPQVETNQLPKLVANAFNDAEASHTLGMCHFYGLAGITKNHAAALEWFTRATKLGKLESAVCVGWIMLERELKKNYRDVEILHSAIAYLEQGKDENIFEIGFPNAVKIEDLVASARNAIATVKPRMAEQPRPSATVIDISRRSQRNA